MKKIIIITIIITTAFFSFTKAQVNITLEEAMLKARTTLAPKALKQLQFQKNSSDYIYLNDNNSWQIGSEKGEKEFITLKQLNAIAIAAQEDSFVIAPRVEFFKNEFTIYGKKGVYTISNGVVKYKTPKELVTKEFIETSSFGLNAYVENYNLYVSDGIKTHQVTKEGSKNIVYAQSVHREEFGISKGTFWSNNGKLLAFYRMDQTKVADYSTINWSSLPAKGENIKYPMAGGTSHFVKLAVYNAITKSTTYIKTPDTDNYLTNICWSPDDKSIFIATVNRKQNEMQLNEYNALTGDFVGTIIKENDEKYIEPLTPMLFVPNSKNEFIWQSNKDGFNHLYLYNTKGNLIKQLTKGNWEVLDIKGFDNSGSNIYFMCTANSAISKNLYVVNLKSGIIKPITNDNYVHNILINDKYDFILDTYSSPTIPKVSQLINLKTGKIKNLLTASNPLSKYKEAKIEIYSIKNGNGDSLYCRKFVPANYDLSKKYPVIIYWYGGPHAQMITNAWNGGAGDYWFQYMAQQGFIVATVDTRGSDNRGKLFEQSIFRNVGAAQNEDLDALLQNLKSTLNIDETRMGLFGWSFGGFTTTNYMLSKPNVFKAAVAGGPVIDWKLYEIMYTERYMDTPDENPEGYNVTDLTKNVQNLKGKLLLIHGMQDPVVVMQHSVNFVRAAIDKNIQVDYMIYPGHEHNVLGKDRLHLYQKITDYFMLHLK